MSYTELLEPILKGGIRSVNFFNGRLLSAEDLKQEQEANREGRSRLGQAVGHGVAGGLEVALSAANTAQTPVVTVGPGLAVNREGRALKLSAAADIALVQQPAEEGTAAGSAFRDCQNKQGGVYLSGAGVYLLTVAPAEGSEGRAPFSGLGNTVVTCNTRYRVEGVRFRLLRLLGSTDLGAINTLRSRVAYDCLGAEALRQFDRSPLAAPLASYGLLDSKRPTELGDDEVPLAIVYWETGGIGFVDNWSVRRPLTLRPASERFEPVAGDRRRAESLAAFLHFQEHVAAIQAPKSNLNPANLKADDHFAYLPPVGLLPLGAERGFDWQKFLGPHAPARETQVDEGLLRSLVESALPLSPVKLNSFAAGSSYGNPPPIPYSVYRVPEANDFVLFARSPRGRVRVFVAPPEALVKAGQVYADDAGRSNLRLGADIVERSGQYPVADLRAGKYTVTVNAPGVIVSSKPGVPVIEGRTTDVLFNVTTPGSLLLTVKDADTEEPIGGDKVQTVTLTPEHGGNPLQASPTADGKWIVTNVPPGTYTVRVTAKNYVPGEKTGVKVVVAETVEESIELHPVPVTTGLVKLEIRDLLSQARIDATADIKMTSRANGAVVTPVLVDNVWTFRDVPAATYDLEVKRQNYNTKTQPVAVVAGQAQTVLVEMRPVNGKLVVRLFDKNTGAAVTNATVSAVAGSERTPGNKVGSQWEISVQPGAYTVEVTAPDYNPTSQGGLTVTPGGTTPANIQLEPVKGVVALGLTWPSGFKLGNFEAVVTPANQGPLAPVSFNENDQATVTNVPAGNVNVRIRLKAPAGAYPDTVFNLTVPPGKTVQQSVGLPSESVFYTIGEDRPRNKPRSNYHWSVNANIVESPPANPYATLTPSMPTRVDVNTWMAAWRDWLVLTRPDLGLDPTATPKEVSRIEGPNVRNRQKQTGRVIFFRPGGSKVGMKLDITTFWEAGPDL